MGLDVYFQRTHARGFLMYAVQTACMVSALACWENRQRLGVRNAYGMCFDETIQQIILFGGADDQAVKSDTWVLDDTVWTMTNSTGPRGRTFPCMAYDGNVEGTLLFGGNIVLFGNEKSRPEVLNDTWLFRNGRWKFVQTTHSPIARAEASMAYDSKRNRMVMFGGYEIVNGNYVKLGDTWEFDGTDWKQVSEMGPGPRSGAAMIFDGQESRTMLFGGGKGGGETWMWDGQTWMKLDVSVPPNVYNASSSYNSQNKTWLRFGGYARDSRIDETWTFSGQWEEKIMKTRPSSRNHAQLAYDSKLDRMVLFGGHDGEQVFGDTWVFQNDQWRMLIEGPVLTRINNGH